MKKLIQPAIVASFGLIVMGAIPGVDHLLITAGAVALIASYVAGVVTLGAEDKDWSSVLREITSERNSMVIRFTSETNRVDKAVADMELRVSTALSKLRSERGPLE